MLKVAWPEPSSAAVPSVVEPSLKVTLPVGIPAPGAVAVTVAVKVIDWPETEGLADEATELVVADWLTVCVSVEEVLVAKSVSPA